MADFKFIAGKLVHCTPSAVGADGASVPFPPDATFQWTASDPAIVFDDASLSSPAYSSQVELTGVVITLTVDEGGFHHEASHTVDIVAAPVDAIATVDFTMSQ